MISLSESSIWLCSFGDTCYPYSIYWLMPVFLLACFGLISFLFWIIKWFIPMGSPSDDFQLWSR